jgi:hypothetical protein
VTFRKIATRFLQTPPDGSKPWWFQNGGVDVFLWVDSKGKLKLMQCAHQETYLAAEAYADWCPGDTGARIGTVSSRRSPLSHASPVVDFNRIPARKHLDHLIDRAVECLPNIAEDLREQVARSLEDVRLFVVRSCPEA